MASWRCGEGAQLRLEVVADFGCVGEQVFFLDGSMTAMATAQASGPPPKVVPCMPAWMARADFFGAEHRAQGNAAGERLGQRGDVGLDAVVLIGAPLAGAAHAGLNLVDDEQRAGGAGEGAGFGEELLRERANAAFALDGLDEDGADFVGELGAQIGDVVEADELDAGNDGRKGLAVLGLVGGGDGAEGAAVEALLEGEELGADLLAFAAQQAGVGARQLERALPGFGAGVGEEDAVEAGALGEAQRELGLALVVVEVRGVDERAALRGDGLFDRRDGRSRAR